VLNAMRRVPTAKVTEKIDNCRAPLCFRFALKATAAIKLRSAAECSRFADQAIE